MVCKYFCLQSVDKSKLPLIYYSQTNAWMNSDLFEGWYNSEFIPSVESELKLLCLEKKAILVLDNAPSHTKICQSNESNLRCVFLPPNTAFLIQPMVKAF